MRILVVGAGALGGTVGALLAESGEDVLFLETNPARVRLLNETGLFISEVGKDERCVRIRVASALEGEAPVDLVFVAVKSYQTEAAVEAAMPVIGPETWVLSLRARTESIVRKSDVVPYFLMPWLGSGSTLRAYPTARFRDRHTLLLAGEIRWFPNRLGLDMALFFDAGKVAPQRSLLTLDGMKTDYGIGVRFHTPAATALRVELAKGLEGWRTVFAASAPF